MGKGKSGIEFAVVTAIAVGLAVLGAGDAVAAPVCNGASITGLGTTLQKHAQQSVLTPLFASEICNKGSYPTVTYNLANSEAAMEEWNSDGKRGSINTAWQFIGTDLPPTASELESIDNVAGGANVVVIPVLQTSIAVIANPPPGCVVEEIANAKLASVFEGVTFSWPQLETVWEEGEEGACEAPITRVVPKGSSGVAYQFKNYLYQINNEGLACTEGATEGKATWQELESTSNGETGMPNTTWPEVCGEKALSGLVRPAGTATSEVVNKVRNTAGSIGFAPLPDAVLNEAPTLLKLQNNGLVKLAKANYAEPTTESGRANCYMRYDVPPGTAEGVDVDWSQVFGDELNIGGEEYPLCMLTYDLAFHGYESAGFSAEDEQTTRDYLAEYLVQTAGQKEFEGKHNHYSPLASSPSESHDVLGAARKAAEKITK